MKKAFLLLAVFLCAAETVYANPPASIFDELELPIFQIIALAVLMGGAWWYTKKKGGDKPQPKQRKRRKK